MIPTLDMDSDDVASQLASALGESGPGFFYVKSSQVQREGIDRLLAAASEFFQLPESEKDEIALDSFRGYR